MTEPTLLDVAEDSIVAEYPEVPDEEANRSAVALRRALAERPPAGLLDAIPGARTLALFFDPLSLSHESLRREALSRAAQSAAPDAGREISIAAVYGGEFGPDLAELASRTGGSPEDFARRHAAGLYRAAFLGFAPGFAYLTGLEPALGAPRLPTPRPRVPPGSVAIGGPYTGVYPTATPGGWRLIARCALRLFDEEMDPPALLQAGDRVRFEAIDAARFAALARETEAARAASPTSPGGRPAFRIVRPGVFTSVQGEPRFGHGSAGLPPGGAMDGRALALGNAGLSNPPGARALEMTLLGPELEATAETAILVSGASMAAERNGLALPAQKPIRLSSGDRLRFGPARGGVRAYLCVEGGFQPAGRFGLTRRLEVGHVLMTDSGRRTAAEASVPTRAGVEDHAVRPSSGREIVLRVVLDPRRDRFFEDRAVDQFFGAVFRVSSTSDRKGVRLDGGPVRASRSPEMPPEGTALGTIQVPPDGRPILLGPDRPITGGYAKLGAVIAADWPEIAQAAPGAAVRFAPVPLSEALRLRVTI